MKSKLKEVEEVVKFVQCLQALLFLINRSIVHFCEWGWVQGSKKKLFFVDIIIVRCQCQCFGATLQ